MKDLTPFNPVKVSRLLPPLPAHCFVPRPPAKAGDPPFPHHFTLVLFCPCGLHVLPGHRRFLRAHLLLTGHVVRHFRALRGDK